MKKSEILKNYRHQLYDLKVAHKQAAKDRDFHYCGILSIQKQSIKHSIINILSITDLK